MFAHRSAPVGVLPTWPLAAGFAGYPLWWVLGVGDLIWPVVALVMMCYLATRGRLHVHVPRGFGLWLLFLVWMAVSVVQLDTAGRFLGFTFRALLYVSATVIFVYVYNAREQITRHYVSRVASVFLAVMTVGGLLGVAFPLLSLRTPLASVLPSSIAGNDFVQEMVVRRVTQFNPDAWAPGTPRPSAPFVYTNGWGYAYAILLPIVIAYAIESRGTRRLRWLVPTIALSTVPALLSLNRGMFVGLGVALVYVLIRAILSRNIKVIGAVLTLTAVGGLVFVALPTEERLSQRLEGSSTTEDRFALYVETIERTAESPIIGFGAPRPSDALGVAVGTQGQVWMVVFSHGFGAIVPFVGWFLSVFRRSWQLGDPVGLAMGAAMASTSVTIFFYGILHTGLMLVFMIAGSVMQPSSGGSPEQLDPARPAGTV
ncbi:O-antigen ligase family protein [Ruania halotolerans]|uniref:O-antigen ligase family protein n=1 Tax=Ruania halotolerans TaxID=2897773 RepID=UPI001E4E31B8|nr:hypothetical protein [Ruania halotolerans]UFU05724.1 hypothetical protein LQF10_14960 [Ruania halotolerans]